MSDALERVHRALAQVAGNTVGSAVTALMAGAGVVLGDPSLVLLSAPLGATIGTAAEEGALFVRAAWSEPSDRVRRFADHIADEEHITVDEVPALGARDERLRRLLSVGVRAAAGADTDSKIRTLAKAFVRGHRDPAAIDEMVYLTELLATLEAPEIRMLAAFSHSAAGQGLTPINAVMNHDPNLVTVMAVLTAKLVDAGLIMRVPAISADGAYSVTPLGRFCVDQLKGLAAAPHDNAE